MISKQELMGKFHEIKGQLKTKFGDLTDDELERASGSVETLVGVVEKKTGRARKEIEALLDEVVNESGSMAQRAAGAAQHYAGQATEAMREGYENVADEFSRGYGQAEAVVRRNPVESVAVALGAGLLVGAVLGLMISSNRR
jgi:uncharacterized protein YjbJ (UPF0337 family)